MASNAIMLPPNEAKPSQTFNLTDLNDRLDSLWISYLRHLDEYTSAQKALQQHMKAGFFSLSRANFIARPGVRYGKDYFHDRAVATSMAKVLENGDEHASRPTVEIIKCTKCFDDEKHGESGEVAQQPSPPATPEHSDTKKVIPESDPESSSDKHEEIGERDAQPKSHSKPSLEADPLRWFGILVPQELRSAQASFTAGLLENMAQATNASRAMRETEVEIRKLRKEIRRAEKAAKI